MKKWLSKVLLLFFILSLSRAQNVAELKKQRMKASEDIENTTRLLQEKGSSKKSLLSNVTLLSTQIAARNNVISNLEVEVKSLDTDLTLNKAKLDSLNHDLELSKLNYQSLIIHAYFHQSKFDDIMFILGSENISIAYKRYKILKEFSSHIKKQGELLLAMSLEQQQLTLLIKSNIDQKQDAKVNLENSAHSLSKEKNTKEILIKDLEKEESWLLKELSKKERFAKALDDQIRLSIEAEARKLAKSNQKYIIPSEFGKAKGNLPWPVEGGTVTSFFGEHDHPILKGIKVKNNGIDIEVTKGTSVKSVFLGTVSKVIAIPGYNMAVIIRHGNYLSVYANLSKVDVSSGDVISRGGVIGLLFSDPDDARSTLHFEIWKESEKIDPIQWLNH